MPLPDRVAARAAGARAALLAALEARGLTGYRASQELAWVVFPPARDGEAALDVLHVPHLNAYRVVACDARPGSPQPARLLGQFGGAEEAAACVAAARVAPAPVERTDSMDPIDARGAAW